MSLNAYLVGLLRGSFCGGGVGGGGGGKINPPPFYPKLVRIINLEIWYRKTHILTDM